MQVGSLVECIITHESYISRGVYKSNIYTIDEIWESKFMGEIGLVLIGLAEIPKETNLVGRRVGFEINDFREIQPPMQIKLEELTSNAVTV